jgi:hypothetical protein
MLKRVGEREKEWTEVDGGKTKPQVKANGGTLFHYTPGKIIHLCSMYFRHSIFCLTQTHFRFWLSCSFIFPSQRLFVSSYCLFIYLSVCLSVWLCKKCSSSDVRLHLCLLNKQTGERIGGPFVSFVYPVCQIYKSPSPLHQLFIRCHLYPDFFSDQYLLGPVLLCFVRHFALWILMSVLKQ